MNKYTENIEDTLIRERTLREIFSELNNFLDLKSTLTTVINRIKQISACNSISIRLKDSEDYPYIVHTGFPDSFIAKEYSLFSKDMSDVPNNQLSNRKSQLECMCGLVMRGDTDPNKPYFTPGGTFWTNSTTDFLLSVGVNELKIKTRNTCNLFGYESVALLPIRTQQEIIGLIQINDERKNMFTIKLINLLETIGDQIGAVVENRIIYSQLERAYEEIKELNIHIKQLADTDSLTGLENRRVFHDRLKQEIERSERYGKDLAILFLDIDDFKLYNDQFGHIEGDKLLVQFAKILRRQIRRSDLPFRFGGEEFTVICPETNVDKAKKVAERIRVAFSSQTFFPKDVNGEEISVNKTVSIGISVNKEKETFKSFVSQADKAMYKAKKIGKNQVFVDY